MKKNKVLQKILTLILVLTMTLNSSSLAFAADAASENDVLDVSTEIDEENTGEMTEEPAYPAFDQEYSVNDSKITLTITAAEGVLPEGTTAEVKKLDYKELQDELDETLVEGEKLSVDAVMFDVNLSDKDGNKIQPNGKVQLIIRNAELNVPEEFKESTTYNAYRINDDKTLNILKENVDVTNGEVEFENDHFTAIGIVAVADMPQENQPVTLAEDEYIYKAYSTAGLEITLEYPDQTQYVAYCFNTLLRTPSVPPESPDAYKLMHENANNAQFVEALDPGTSHTNINTAKTDLETIVKNLIYAGYPYKGVPEIKDYAYNKLGMSDKNYDYKLRMATQYAIWYFTDNDARYKTTNAQAWLDEKALAGYMVNWAKKQDSLIKNLKLDLFAPEYKGNQNLLVTRIKEGETPPPVGATLDVPVYKYEKYQTLDGEWVKTKTPISGVTFTLSKVGDTSFNKTSTTGINGTVTFTELTAGSYIINEAVGQNGFESIADGTIQFTIDDDLNLTDTNNKNDGSAYEVNSDAKEIYIYNGHGGFTFNKIGIEDEVLGGAEFELEWIPSASGAAAANITQRDNIKNSIGNDTTYDAFEDSTRQKTWLLYNNTSESGTAEGTWTSSDQGGMTVSLPDGVYRLTETWAPTGYQNMGTIGFILKTEDGKQKMYVYQNEENGGFIQLAEGSNVIEDQQVTIIDQSEPMKIVVSKINADKAMIIGATLQVENLETNETEEWETDGLEHFLDLIPGQYVLREVEAPTGYLPFDDVLFEVTEKGTIEIVSETDAASVEGDDYNILTVTDQYDETSVTVQKKWSDNDDQDGIRPNSVTVTLYADEKATDESKALTNAGGWKATFENLRKYDDEGSEINYTVQETEVAGYTDTITGDAQKGYTITNTHTPEVINIEGTKTWEDNNNSLGNRPDEITVVLKADGQEVERKTVTAKDNWKYKFENKPQYNNKKEIQYTVEEAVVPTGYQSQVTGYDIKNTYDPKYVAVHVTKQWEDNNNSDGHRPNSVTVHLLENGEDSGMQAVLTEQNGWYAEFTNLPVKKNNKDVEYTVSEDKVEEYDEPVITTEPGEPKHITITNRHTPEVISITGTKSWNDNDDQDGKRPDSVEVLLKVNGEVVQRATTSEEEGWSYTFKNLPEYKDGKKIVYAVQEGKVADGYQSAISGFDITNTYNPEKVSVQVMKSWIDNEDQDGLRAKSVTIHLIANGMDTGKMAILNEANGWQSSFDELDRYQDGKEIAYTVTEDPVKGYITSVTTGADEKHFIVTNTHTTEMVNVAGAKTWDDKEDQDGKRPEFIQVQIFANDVGGEIKTVREQDNWSWNFTNLPKYKNGTLINYKVKEVNPPEGYQSSVNGYNITNSYTPGKIAVHVDKAWNDNNNQDGIRPQSITVHLYADGKDTKESKILNEGTQWEAEFTNLDEYKDGEKIVYTVVEDTAKGYTAEINTTDQDGKHFKIINTHTPEVTKVEGTKSWDDAEDQDGKRPESVEVILKKAGQEIARKTVTEKDGWKYSFTDLPKYENNGSVIRYTVQEGKVAEGYQSIVNGTNITNKYTPGKIAIQVAKSWIDNDNQDGIRPSSVTVHLYANGEDTGKTVVLNTGNKWIADFDNLDEYQDGDKIIYTVTEDEVANYKTTITTGADEKHFTITNTHTPELTTVSGVKSWDDADNQDGKRPESVEIILKRSGQEIARKTVTEKDGWKYSFTNLPRYENEGAVIRYTVQEGKVAEGYQSVVNGTNITNKYTPGKIAIQVAKSWLDHDNQDGIRPNSVTVHLYADGVDTGKTVTLNEGNKWIADFNDLPEKKFGKKVEYTVQEDKVTGYKATITTGADEKHFTITNTHTPEVTKVEGTKSWDDNNNSAGKRPESVEVILKKAGQEIARKTVTEKDGWKYSFTNLPKYENKGAAIRYTVQEGKVAEGYQSEVHGTDLTNRYTPGKIAIQAAKSWVDHDNQDGIRPSSVTVHLYADGKDTGKTVILNEGNKWIADFKDLAEYQNGKKIIYTITEDAVKGYTTVITNGADEKHFTITNTHTPEVTKVEGTKSWDDANDQDGKRPESVEVILKKAGQEIARKTVTAEDGWKYSFENLPKYENNGSVIRYTVQEGKVAEGYQSIVTGYDITNKYTPGKVGIQVAKSWIDNDNQDGIRPKSVTVHLYANGIDTGKKLELNADNNWIGEFNDLNEKAAKMPITYTITEDHVNGYTTTITTGADQKHFTITNTHTPEVTKVEGTKSWNDNNNANGERPDSVVIILKKSGQEIDRKTVTAEDDWKYSFTNLPKNEGGTEIRYSVEEANVPDNYQSSIDGYDIMNTYTFGKIAIQVSKSWQDYRNLDGVRPSSITVWLYENGVETKNSVTLNAENNWTANFSNLDVTKDGKKVAYTVREEAVKEYDTTYETTQDGKHITITNTHTPERVSVSVEKQWDDNENAYGCRPTNVKIILYEEYEGKLYPVTYGYISEAEGWKYTFDNLPKYAYDFIKRTFIYDEDGNKEVVKYTVREHIDDLPEGYVADPEVVENAENDYTIINKADTKKVKFSKTDIGGNELFGAEIKVSGTTSAGKAIEESWISGGSARELDLPTGEYTMTEVSEPLGYKIATEITFTVNEDGTITVDGTTTQSEDENIVTMVDDFVPRKVTFSKTDIAGNERKGATITLTGKNAAGQDISEFMKKEDIQWISDGTAKEIELPKGIYTMTETAAPEGYEISTEITFTVNSNGTITVNGVESGSEDNNVVTMVDGYTLHKVIFSKTDIAGKELEGAEITVSGKNAAGMEITESWKSDGIAKELKLSMGEYTMTETAAPEGYEIATEITFTVNKDGTITVNDVTTASEDDNVVTMIDDYTRHKVTFSKTDIEGNELKGADIVLTGKNAAGQDISEFMKEEDIKWTSDGTAKELELPAGTYTMTETAAPEGYEIATAITFTVNKDGTIISEDVELQGDDAKVIVMVDDYKMNPNDKPSEEKPNDKPSKDTPDKDITKDTPKKDTTQETPKQETPKVSKQPTAKTGSATSTRGTVRTGDTANPAIWITLLGIAAVSIVVIARKRKK